MLHIISIYFHQRLCVILTDYTYLKFHSQHPFPKIIFSIQECLGVLAARCVSCNCMTYFYCAPLQSCRRLYQLGD
ncbi:hypothetical protein DWZ93_08370 [Dorea sp. AF36-15AT]|nr:hypothetical protein DWZ93_08370 [Dorea sp. AF36-15AT]